MNCPTCGNTIEWKGNPFRPFCSERCKLLDLGAWVNEEYAVPAEETNVPAESKIPEPSPTSEEKENSHR